MNKLRQFKYRILSPLMFCSAMLAAVGPVAAQTPVASGNLGPTLNRIASSGNLFAAHREVAIPFSYVVEGKDDAAIYGYSWEICGHIAKAVQQRLGRDVRVVPVNVSANSRIMMVKVGMAEIECGATTNNVARQKQVAFSNTIYVAEVRLMVHKNSGIKRVADLANKRVVTTLGTTADRLIKQAALVNNIVIQNLIGRSHAESIEMIIRGEADAYVGDDAILAGVRANSPLKEDLVFLDESLASEPYGIMLPHGDTAFKALVDESIVGLMRSGEFAKIYDKWFMNPIPPNGANLQMPMSEKLKAAIASPNDRPAN